MQILKYLNVSVRLLIVGLLVFSVIYPLALGGVGQIWSAQARGSLVRHQGEPVGSEIIGQQFTSDRYFHPRPSSKNYDAMNSASANLAYGNPRLEQRVKNQLSRLAESSEAAREVPVDLVTESGSALDPHISPKAARFQVPRISAATGLGEQKLNELINAQTRGKLLGVFGQPRVNVLKLNLKLEELIRE